MDTSPEKTLHLIKLCVGCDSVAELAAWQKQRLKQMGEIIHITRQTPKRAEELLSGGSIYWVINGFVSVRQRIIELRPLLRDGVPHCGLVLDKELTRVRPRPRKAFQGWRYFEGKDAPPDLHSHNEELPEKILRELAQLGLI